MKKGACNAWGSTSPLNISRKKALPPPLRALPANQTPGTKPGRPCKKPLMCPKSLASPAQVVFSQRGPGEDWRGTTHLWAKGQNFCIHSDSHIFVDEQKHGSSPQHEQVRSQTLVTLVKDMEKVLKHFLVAFLGGIFPSDELLWAFGVLKHSDSEAHTLA